MNQQQVADLLALVGQANSLCLARNGMERRGASDAAIKQQEEILKQNIDTLIRKREEIWGRTLKA